MKISYVVSKITKCGCHALSGIPELFVVANIFLKNYQLFLKLPNCRIAADINNVRSVRMFIAFDSLIQHNNTGIFHEVCCRGQHRSMFNIHDVLTEFCL